MHVYNHNKRRTFNNTIGGENAQMKFLFAPDSFKGTISSTCAIEMLQTVANKYFPDAVTVGVPIGDGGEGTTEALVKVLSGEYRHTDVTDPFGRKVTAQYAIINQRIAVIEMAQASGLPLLSPDEKNPLLASSFGTGEMINDALSLGVNEVYLMIGGSATNDGGIGMAMALGMKFTDADGQEVSPNGQGLSRVAAIDLSGMNPRIRDTKFTIMCDVTNPLLGPNGATYVYGQQKGATSEMQQELEIGMANFIDVIEQKANIDIRTLPGSGAAGGLAITLIAFAGAVLKSGIATVLDIIEFDKLLEGVDLVVTGEGRLDYQSAQGKVLYGIGNACKKKGIPVCAIAGCFGDGAEQIYDCGVDVAISCTTGTVSSEELLKNANARFMTAAETLFRALKIGIGIAKK